MDTDKCRGPRETRQVSQAASRSRWEQDATGPHLLPQSCRVGTPVVRGGRSCPGPDSGAEGRTAAHTATTDYATVNPSCCSCWSWQNAIGRRPARRTASESQVAAKSHHKGGSTIEITGRDTIRFIDNSGMLLTEGRRPYLLLSTRSC